MKKQIIIASLLILLALVLGMMGSVLAVNNEIEPRSNNGVTTIENNQQIGNELQGNAAWYENVLENNQSQKEDLQNNDLNTINEQLKNIASAQYKDSRKAIVTAIIVITIVLIAGLIMWWYKTNY